MTDAERRLRRALREQRAPDENEAELRAWRIVSAAPPGGGATGLRRRLRLRRAAQLAAATTAVALIASPAGASVRHWIADRIAPGVEGARPVLGGLPGGGSLLVQSRSGPWVVRPDGSKRLLGAFSEASWSPHGLFVAATSRRELAAVDPAGEVRWALARPGPVRLARWNGPDGYRIAYLDGAALRVVDGNGLDDRLLAPRAAPVAPAWKPGTDHVLAFARSDGAVEALSADTRIRLFVTAPGPLPTSLQWGPAGLLVTGPPELRLFDASGRSLWRWKAPPGSRVLSATAAPSGREIAVVLHGGGASRLLDLRPGEGGHPLFAGPGRFAKPFWSPGGRWLLLPWPSADQWLFIRPARPAARLHAVADIAAQFSPGERGHPPFPALAGWCCPR